MEDHRDYRLTAYLFDSLSVEGRRDVEAHLVDCARCREELVALQATLGLVKSALPADQDAAGALEETRRAQVLGAWESARVRTGWIVGISGATAALLLVGGLFFLFAGMHAGVRPKAVPARELAAGRSFYNASGIDIPASSGPAAAPAPPTLAPPAAAEPQGRVSQEALVAGGSDAVGLGATPTLAVRPFEVATTTAPQPPAETAAAAETPVVSGDGSTTLFSDAIETPAKAPERRIRAALGASERQAELSVDAEGRAQEARPPEPMAQVAMDDANGVIDINNTGAGLVGALDKKSEEKSRATGANNAIGIGGGAAGAYGRRWGEGAKPESKRELSGDEYGAAERGREEGEREVLDSGLRTVDIPLGTTIDNRTNVQLAKEDNGRGEERAPAVRKAPPPYDPTVKRSTKRVGVVKKAPEAAPAASSGKPETTTPDRPQGTRDVAELRLLRREESTRADFIRGDVNSDMQLMVESEELDKEPILMDPQAPGGKARWERVNKRLETSHTDLSGGFGFVEKNKDSAPAQNQPSTAAGEMPQFGATVYRHFAGRSGDAPQTGPALPGQAKEHAKDVDVAKYVVDGIKASQIQGWSFGVTADQLQGMTGAIKSESQILAYEPLAGQTAVMRARGGIVTLGKPGVTPDGIPIGAESVLRAYAYYRVLDANLDLGNFTAHLVPVPPPSVDAEGLTQEEFRARYSANPFVDTRSDHFSTFGMDVDTAAYTRARDALRANKMPEPKSVRVEEFVNYFPEDYVADPESAFSVFCEGGPSPFGQGFELLKIAVKARELRRDERKNAVLTFAVDVSGSMAASAGGQTADATAPTRLALVAHALATLVDALGSDDRVGIVAYSTHPTLILPHTAVRERRRILGAIESLASGGATNIEAGLDLAYRVADEVFDAKALNRVILCSDGVANLGARGPEEILKKVTVFARRGIYLSAVGFGTGKYNDAMLVELSDKGNGNYRHVDSPAEAARIFYQDLPKTLDVLAQDAKIQVDFNPDVVSHYRLLGYEKRDIKDQDFRNDKVDAGEVGPGTTVTVLYEIKRRTNPQGDIGRIYLRYREAGTGRIEETNYPLSAGVLAVSVRDTTDRFRFIAAAAETAELLRESYFARDGSFEKVAALLARASPEFMARPEWVELNELVSRAWRLSIERLGALAVSR